MLLLALCTLSSTFTNGSPRPRFGTLQLSPTESYISNNHPRLFVRSKPNRMARRNDDEEDEDVVIYKTKQPSTPPNSLPSDPFAHYTYENTLTSGDFQVSQARRTIVVGDIHGSLVGFDGFLKQIGYDGTKDNLILAGDLVAKGPQSVEVIDRARSLNAKCVRGNHDDKVIRWKGYLDSLSPSQKSMLEMDSKSRPDVLDDENAPEYDADVPSVRPLAQMRDIPADLVENSEHHRIASKMNDDQYQYLLSCPLVLTLPKEMSVHKTPVHVLHAGIDPSKDIEHQLPWVLVNVRNILKDGTPSRKKKKGQGWASEFNNEHSRFVGKGQDYLVVYGHDASRSLNVKQWSIGLDSGCVYGRALSGYVVETGQIYTVPCPDLDVDPGEE
ncbi:hypothetical protein EMPS_04880 [Entomortierella parvispora]|uniref:Calcineurin-like phosphoesterase domain-containing protein n=1 Tax=Entomortierella parvispora TaxID=205924 RepID=A0A9P3H9F4_9FUNG|nr:hypothetical protein EMPS_04880 [Entomortierella parvispora]